MTTKAKRISLGVGPCAEVTKRTWSERLSKVNQQFGLKSKAKAVKFIEADLYSNVVSTSAAPTLTVGTGGVRMTKIGSESIEVASWKLKSLILMMCGIGIYMTITPLITQSSA